jgi:tRNA (guanine37-N1)-methyltransferase
MRIDIITLFPTMFAETLSASLLGKAISDGLIEVTIHDLREHGLGRHRSVDDTPYGGGAGMVMRPEPLFAAIEAATTEDSHVILMTPRGSLFDHAGAERLAAYDHLVLVCGRYEGVDQRVIDELVDEEISIGDYVLAGGELAAMVVIEALSRFVPGVLGNPESLATESHAAGALEHPQYTRPADFRGLKVPEILLSGHHEEVDRWREEESRRLTHERRPDLLGDG